MNEGSRRRWSPRAAFAPPRSTFCSLSGRSCALLRAGPAPATSGSSTCVYSRRARGIQPLHARMCAPAVTAFYKPMLTIATQSQAIAVSSGYMPAITEADLRGYEPVPLVSRRVGIVSSDGPARQSPNAHAIRYAVLMHARSVLRSRHRARPATSQWHRGTPQPQADAATVSGGTSRGSTAKNVTRCEVERSWREWEIPVLHARLVCCSKA